MVDINLYKEDDEQGKKDELLPEENDDLESEMGEELGFEEDVLEPALEEDNALEGMADEDGAEDESYASDLDDDFEFEDAEKGRPLTWLWILLAGLTTVLLLLFFVILPGRKKPGPPPTVINRPAVTAPVMPDSSAAVAAQSDSDVSPEAMSAIKVGLPVPRIPSETFVNASRTVLADLTKQGQFGTFLITGDRFFVEYVSETPGVAESMGEKVKTLLGVDEFTASPEDKHVTAGRVYYWGVVSGKFPPAATGTGAINFENFKTSDAFMIGVKNFVEGSDLIVRDVKKLAETSEEKMTKTAVRVIAEGTKQNTMQFLSALEGFQSNSHLAKLLLAPVNYSDFQAMRVKIVLDFLVYSQDSA